MGNPFPMHYTASLIVSIRRVDSAHLYFQLLVFRNETTTGIRPLAV